VTEERKFTPGFPSQVYTEDRESCVFEILMLNGSTNFASVDLSRHYYSEGTQWRSAKDGGVIPTYLVAGWRIPEEPETIEGRFSRATRQIDHSYIIYNPEGNLHQVAKNYNTARLTINRLDFLERRKIDSKEFRKGERFTAEEIVENHNGNPHYKGQIYHPLVDLHY
jgi:hypothetical protein